MLRSDLDRGLRAEPSSRQQMFPIEENSAGEGRTGEMADGVQEALTEVEERCWRVICPCFYRPREHYTRSRDRV